MKSLKKTAQILFCLAAMFAMMSVMSVTGFAADKVAEVVPTATAPVEEKADMGPAFAYIAAALSTGLGAIGAGIAVGAGAPAAIGALTEDPKSFGKALIFVALGEGIALYGMLISILILAKV